MATLCSLNIFLLFKICDSTMLMLIILNVDTDRDVSKAVQKVLTLASRYWSTNSIVVNFISIHHLKETQHMSNHLN